MVLKEFEKFNQELKGCSWHEEKTKVLLMHFYRIFDCPKVNFGPLSTFAPWKGWRGTWKRYFPVKNSFSVKNLLWTILCPKMMASLNSGCNVSIRASLLSVQVYKFINIQNASFLDLPKGFLGNCYCLPDRYYMVLHLFSLTVPSSHWLQLEFEVFTRYSQ